MYSKASWALDHSASGFSLSPSPGSVRASHSPLPRAREEQGHLDHSVLWSPWGHPASQRQSLCSVEGREVLKPSSEEELTLA